jgi:hypothetical protein
MKILTRKDITRLMKKNEIQLKKDLIDFVKEEDNKIENEIKGGNDIKKKYIEHKNKKKDKPLKFIDTTKLL